MDEARLAQLNVRSTVRPERRSLDDPWQPDNGGSVGGGTAQDGARPVRLIGTMPDPVSATSDGLLVSPASRLSVRRRAALALAPVVGRSLDMVIALVALVLLAPLLLAIVVAVRVDSGGPTIFRQRRVGRGMSSFVLYKFRTMRPGADAEPHRAYVQALISSEQRSEGGHLYKLSVDDRITPVGRFLRSWSLDELPQLINVLRGEMALVGPRPVIPYEVELYPDSYMQRFDVKPGLTGLWQVSGRNARTYHEMVCCDIEYAQHRSLLLDLRILVKTIGVVLLRRGVA